MVHYWLAFFTEVTLLVVGDVKEEQGGPCRDHQCVLQTTPNIGVHLTFVVLPPLDMNTIGLVSCKYIQLWWFQLHVIEQSFLQIRPARRCDKALFSMKMQSQKQPAKGLWLGIPYDHLLTWWFIPNKVETQAIQKSDVSWQWCLKIQNISNSFFNHSYSMIQW